MVAERGSGSMAMNSFADTINEMEQLINPQDPLSLKIRDLFQMMNSGFVVFHKQVSDINSQLSTSDSQQKISNLDLLTQQVNTSLHSLANQVAQNQYATGHQHQHKKGILEFKVVQTIKPLTGNISQFRQWHQKLINALSTIKEDHSEIIKTIEKQWLLATQFRTH